jgi:hypothetical protein
MLGGVIEYAALITGYRALLIAVACLYGLAWFFATRLRILADVGLAAESSEMEASTASTALGS